MLQWLGQMAKLPLEAFVFGMEMFVKTIQGVQQVAYQGIDMLAEGASQTLTNASGRGHHATRDVPNDIAASGEDVKTSQLTTQQKEERMPDTNLSGKDLKLVRYKILFVRRDYEVAFPEEEELVSEDTDASGFTAWKIAQFIQNLQINPPVVRRPKKWVEKNYPPPPYTTGDYFTGMPDDDKKYLRVYFDVLQRYQREPLKYEEEQLDILRGIRDDLGGIRRGVGPQ